MRMLTKLLLVLCILSAVSSPGVAQSAPGSFTHSRTYADLDLYEPVRPFRRDSVADSDWLYWTSVSALVVTTTLDHHSSLGQFERNRLLQDRDGRYHSGRGAAMKYGTAAGLVLLQRYTVRRHPRLKWVATAANFALAGWFGSIAHSNYRHR